MTLPAASGQVLGSKDVIFSALGGGVLDGHFSRFELTLPPPKEGQPVPGMLLSR